MKGDGSYQFSEEEIYKDTFLWWAKVLASVLLVIVIFSIVMSMGAGVLLSLIVTVTSCLALFVVTLMAMVNRESKFRGEFDSETDTELPIDEPVAKMKVKK